MAAEWSTEIDILRRANIAIDIGLGPSEISAVQEYLGFALPPDLLSFLSEVLPTGEDFPNWRALDINL
jgi:hypothetical protein